MRLSEGERPIDSDPPIPKVTGVEGNLRFVRPAEIRNPYGTSRQK